MKRRETYLAISFVGALLLVACAPTAQAEDCPDDGGVNPTITGCLEASNELRVWAAATSAAASDYGFATVAWAQDPSVLTSVYQYEGVLNVYIGQNSGVATNWAYATVLAPGFDVVTFVAIDGTTYAVGARAWANAYADDYEGQAVSYTTARVSSLEPYARDVGDAVRDDTIWNVNYYSCFVLGNGGCDAPRFGVPPPPSPGTAPVPTVPGSPGTPGPAPQPGTPTVPGLNPSVPTNYTPPCPPAPPTIAPPPIRS
jgi:hypothetical protein